MSVLTGKGQPDGEHRKVYILIRRPYAYLADLLAKAFEGRRDIEIFVDRRHGERRTRQQPVTIERRRAKRRRRKEVQFEVVIGTIFLPNETL